MPAREKPAEYCSRRHPNMKITFADLGVQPHRATECLEAGWEAFADKKPMSTVPPWFNAAERVLFHLAYGGYITSVNDLPDD